MFWSAPNREAELEAKLDKLPRDLAKNKPGLLDDSSTDLPRKKRSRSPENDPKAGRFVALILLLITAMLSALLWAFKR